MLVRGLSPCASKSAAQAAYFKEDEDGETRSKGEDDCLEG